MIDLSDNDLMRLDNFPLLPRLHTLILNNNRISRIAPALSSCLPGLTHVILTNNAIASHHSLAPLHHLPLLSHLSLRLCPVSRLPDYRLLVLHMLPRLRVLDWQKVKEKERKASKEQFGVWVERKEDEEERLGTASKEKAAQQLNGAEAAGGMKEEAAALAARMQQLIASIEQASSLEEINALEQQLAELSQQQGKALQT